MRLRHAFVLVLAVVTVVLGLAVLSGFALYDSAVEENRVDSLETTAETTAVQVDGLLSERSRTVELQARDPVLLGPADQRRDALSRFVETTSFQGVSVLDRDGRMVAIDSVGLSSADRDSLIGTDLSDRTYFQRAISGESYVSEPVQAETGNFIVTLSQPVEDDGEIVGTLNAALHLHDGALFESVIPDESGETAVRVESNGQMLYETGPWNGSNLLQAAAAVETTGWTVTVARPSATDGSQTRTATALQFLAAALVLGTLVAFGLWFQRSNLRQIDELLEGFDRLADREYGAEVGLGGTEEWDRIGTRFNDVSRALADHERELEQYREIVERVDDPIELQDRDGNYLLINDAVTDLAGLSETELVGADESRFMDETTVSLIERKKAEVIETERPVEYEISSVSDGSGPERTFSVRRFPYYDESGDLVGTLAVSRDITSQKERETELRQYKRAITGATDLICAVDSDGKYLFANPQYRAYHGIDRVGIGDLDTASVFDEETDEDITEYSQRALAGESVKYQMTRVHPTRGERILDVRYYPLGGVETTGFVAVLRDVTEREERARQLRVVDRVLRHNLRNDLTVVQLEAERIADGAEGTIADAATEILSHSEGLLTTSRKSRNITEVLSESPTLRSIEITPLLDRIVETFTGEHPEASIEIDTPAELTVSATVSLQKAIEELVANAIVHSDRESPSIELRAE